MASPSSTARPSAAPGALTPHLVVRGAAAAIDFYRRAFGARERMRLGEPGGRIGHAEIEIGGHLLMLADEYPEYGILSPQSLGGTASSLQLKVADVDAIVERAVAAGATVERPPTDEFYGERIARIRDPFGHWWHLATRIEELSREEVQRRYDALLAQKGDRGTEPPPSVAAAPAGFHTVTPYITLRRAAELLEWVERALGATEVVRTTGSAGGLHAEVRIGNSMLMIGGGPHLELDEKPAALYVYFDDVDAAYRRALEAGAISSKSPANQPYGDRNATVEDPFGNTWYLATHLGVPAGGSS